MSEIAQPTVNPEKLNAFVGRMLGDLGALTNAVLVHVGDQLGLYKALAASGATTSAPHAATNNGYPGMRNAYTASANRRSTKTRPLPCRTFSPTPRPARTTQGTSIGRRGTMRMNWSRA